MNHFYSYIYILYIIGMGQTLDILRNSLGDHGGIHLHISIYWIYKYIKNYVFHSVSCIAVNLCENHCNSLCFCITFLTFYQKVLQTHVNRCCFRKRSRQVGKAYKTQWIINILIYTYYISSGWDKHHIFSEILWGAMGAPTSICLYI